jgi:hypothetical protein
VICAYIRRSASQFDTDQAGYAYAYADDDDGLPNGRPNAKFSSI